MAATLSAYNAVLQRIWTQKTLEEQLYQDTPLLSTIEKTQRFNVGEVARVPLHVSRNGGYSVLPAGGGNLTAAGNQGIQKNEYNWTNHHQQIAIQGDAIDGTASDAQSIVNVVNNEVDGALTDMRRQLQRQIFSDASGKIAQCRTSDSNNVDINATANGGLFTGLNAINRGWLFVNQPVVVQTTGGTGVTNGGSNTSPATITAIDNTAATPNFTVDLGNVTGEGTTHFVYQAKSNVSGTSYEMNGLANLVSTGSFGTLSSSTEPTWQATNNSTSQSQSIALLLTGNQQVQQATGKKADLIVTGLRQGVKFYSNLQQQVRFSSDAAIDAGGEDKATWRGQQIVEDPDCPDTDLYMLQKAHLFIVAIDKPYWQNKVTGGEILSWVQGTDSYGAKLTYRINLATNRRNSHYRFSAFN